MKINIINFENLILAILSICGEIDEQYLLSRLDSSITRNYSSDYVKVRLRVMSSENLINRRKYKSSESSGLYIRLSSIAGYERVESLSQDLMLHFATMAGDKNNRYKGSPSKLRRKREKMFLSLVHLLDGFCVDLFRIEYSEENNSDGNLNKHKFQFRDSVYDENGKLYHPEKILGRIRENQKYYITSGVIRDEKNKAASILKGDSQYVGLLIKLPITYICYYIPYPDYPWTSLERQFKLVITNYLRRSIGEGRARPPAAIFYIKNEEVYYNFIKVPEKKTSEKKKCRRLNPADIYNSGILLPLDIPNYREIREILLMDDGEDKLSKVILGDNYIKSNSYDGKINDCKIYNLLLSDYVKMQRIRNSVKREDSIIVIHKWQERTMKEFYGENVRMTIINDQAFKELYSKIQNNKKRE